MHAFAYVLRYGDSKPLNTQHQDATRNKYFIRLHERSKHPFLASCRFALEANELAQAENLML